MSLQELNPDIAAQVTKGKWEGNAPATWNKIEFDSRNLKEGQIFIALRDKRDGHDFVEQAQQKSASAAIVEKKIDCDLPQLIVKDSLQALHELATYHRQSYTGEMILVTGSNGKSTTKEMLASIATQWLGSNLVFATYGNRNNHIGLPLCLLDLEPQHEVTILEAGMNHAGEITTLANLAKPKYGIITNAGRAHLGNFDSEEGIARAKGELIECLDDQGTIVLNADDTFFDLWTELAQGKQIMSFSHDGKFGSHCRRIQDREFMFAFDGTSNPLQIDLQVGGRHNEENAMAAATMAWCLGARMEDIRLGLEEFSGVPGRQQVTLLSSMVLIDDTYNSSPESVLAAIEALAQRPEYKKLLILGDMLELGECAQREHEKAIRQALDLGIESVLGFGEITSKAIAAIGTPAESFASKDELVERTKQLANGGVAVLVKGSRGMHMEEIVNQLLAG